MTVVASAPGKIVLSGEYAVLDGGPAISMAVDRRAVVTMEDRPEGQCDLSTPGFEGKNKYRIVDAVCGGSRPAKNIVMDTRAFTEDGEKTGIGSSAALTVALVACLREAAAISGAISSQIELTRLAPIASQVSTSTCTAISGRPSGSSNRRVSISRTPPPRATSRG